MVDIELFLYVVINIRILNVYGDLETSLVLIASDIMNDFKSATSAILHDFRSLDFRRSI